MWVEDDTVVEREAQLEHRGVAAEVLVGQEQHLLAPVERPGQRLASIRRGAHRSAVAAAERLDVRTGVHVCHRHRQRGDACVAEHVPGVLDLLQARHVGHRAAGREVGQDYLLVLGGEDVGRLGHEVHTAENDVRRIRAGRRLARQRERVTGDVGELDDLVALVVVAEHEQPIAQSSLGQSGPLHQVWVGRGR